MCDAPEKLACQIVSPMLNGWFTHKDTEMLMLSKDVTVSLKCSKIPLVELGQSTGTVSIPLANVQFQCLFFDRRSSLRPCELDPRIRVLAYGV